MKLTEQIKVTSTDIGNVKAVMEATAQAQRDLAEQHHHSLHEAPETTTALLERRFMTKAAVISIQGKIEALAAQIKRETSVSKKLDLMADITKWNAGLTAFGITQQFDKK